MDNWLSMIQVPIMDDKLKPEAEDNSKELQQEEPSNKSILHNGKN